jgi:hypothetical protein
MDPAVLAFLVALAVASGIPAWLTGSILRKYARQEGAAGWDWIPFGLAPFAFARFRHPHRGAIVWAYLFSNLLFLGAVVAFFVLRK